MKKKLLFITAALLALSACKSMPAYAGLITHTDYTPGSVITSAAQNTNENTIVNEFNGNVNSANIATGGVTSTNILDGTIQNVDLNTALQSSVTVTNNVINYVRPTLNHQGDTTADVQNNTTTANETCIIFHDGTKRCVTEDTSSTNKYRRFDTGATCNFISGTEDSGIRSGESYAGNSWINVYAVKSNVDATKFVLCGSSMTPVIGNAPSLNANFGLYGWVYLQVLASGDNLLAISAIVKFEQTGNLTLLTNTAKGYMGIRLTSATANTTQYVYAIGSTIPNIPQQLHEVIVTATCGAATANECIVNDSADIANITNFATVNLGSPMARVTTTIKNGFSVSLNSGASTLKRVMLVGWYDDALGVGYNPQLGF